MMKSKRNPDWNGHGPKNDKEARELVIGAAVKIAERDGLRKTNIKKVADELGITRQTVYRLFPSTEKLLTDISMATGGKILDRLLERTKGYTKFEDRVVEGMIFLARNIPKDEFLRRYFLPAAAGGGNIGDTFTRDALDYSFHMLKAMVPGNARYPDQWLMELAEHQQRILLAMIIAPSDRIKSTQGMRDYLDKWLRPLLKPLH